MKQLVAQFAIAAVLGVGLGAQEPSVRVTEAQARQWAAAAAAESTTALSPTWVFDVTFAEKVKTVAPDYDSDMHGGVIIDVSEKLAVILLGPVARFASSASERIRKFEPVASAIWTAGVAITVTPRQIGSPDIERVVLQRNGVMVKPTTSALLPSALSTRMGAKMVLHEGTVIFPIEAFAPGATVVVTAIPAVGSNIAKTLTEKELRGIQ